MDLRAVPMIARPPISMLHGRVAQAAACVFFIMASRSNVLAIRMVLGIHGPMFGNEGRNGIFAVRTVLCK